MKVAQYTICAIFFKAKGKIENLKGFQVVYLLLPFFSYVLRGAVLFVTHGMTRIPRGDEMVSHVHQA